MVRYYRDPDGTQVLSASADKTPASQTGIGKLDSSDTVDVLKQRVTKLEDLLNKHNVSCFSFSC